MIKMNLFLTRRPDLTFDQFTDYWQNIHWPKIKNDTRATEFSMGYSQQHRIPGVPPGVAEARYDGIVEGWFSDIDNLYAMLGTPEWAAILADEANFIDRSKLLMLLTEEKVCWRSEMQS